MGYSKNQPAKHQSHLGQLPSLQDLCNCKVAFFLWPDGYYYLDRKSHLHHIGHWPIPREATIHGSMSITDKSLKFFRTFSSIGIKTSNAPDILQVMEGSDKNSAAGLYAIFFRNLKS